MNRLYKTYLFIRRNVRQVFKSIFKFFIALNASTKLKLSIKNAEADKLTANLHLDEDNLNTHVSVQESEPSFIVPEIYFGQTEEISFKDLHIELVNPDYLSSNIDFGVETIKFNTWLTVPKEVADVFRSTISISSREILMLPDIWDTKAKTLHFSADGIIGQPITTNISSQANKANFINPFITSNSYILPDLTSNISDNILFDPNNISNIFKIGINLPDNVNIKFNPEIATSRLDYPIKSIWWCKLKPWLPIANINFVYDIQNIDSVPLTPRVTHFNLPFSATLVPTVDHGVYFRVNLAHIFASKFNFIGYPATGDLISNLNLATFKIPFKILNTLPATFGNLCNITLLKWARISLGALSLPAAFGQLGHWEISHTFKTSIRAIGALAATFGSLENFHISHIINSYSTPTALVYSAINADLQNYHIDNTITSRSTPASTLLNAMSAWAKYHISDTIIVKNLTLLDSIVSSSLGYLLGTKLKVLPLNILLSAKPEKFKSLLVLDTPILSKIQITETASDKIILYNNLVSDNLFNWNLLFNSISPENFSVNLVLNDEVIKKFNLNLNNLFSKQFNPKLVIKSEDLTEKYYINLLQKAPIKLASNSWIDNAIKEKINISKKLPLYINDIHLDTNMPLSFTSTMKVSVHEFTFLDHVNVTTITALNLINKVNDHISSLFITNTLLANSSILSILADAEPALAAANLTDTTSASAKAISSINSSFKAKSLLFTLHMQSTLYPLAGSYKNLDWGIIHLGTLNLANKWKAPFIFRPPHHLYFSDIEGELIKASSTMFLREQEHLATLIKNIDLTINLPINNNIANSSKLLFNTETSLNTSFIYLKFAKLNEYSQSIHTLGSMSESTVHDLTYYKHSY